MKKNIILPIVSIVIVSGLNSCAPQIRSLQPNGDTAQIILKDKREFVGELLAISDSTVLADLQPGSKDRSDLSKRRITEIHFDDLQSIRINDYSNTKWKQAIILFEVIPTILMGIAAGSEDTEPLQVMAILSIPTFLSLAILASSTPAPPGITAPHSTDQFMDMKKYSRFPQGLTGAQLDKLLTVKKQSKVSQIK